MKSKDDQSFIDISSSSVLVDFSFPDLLPLAEEQHQIVTLGRAKPEAEFK